MNDQPHKRFSAFHGEDALKEKLIVRLTQLIDSRIIEPNHAPTEDGSGSLVAELLRHSSCENCDVFSAAVGFPEWVTRCYEMLFENLPDEPARRWVVDFLSSIPVGADLNELKYDLYEGLLCSQEIGVGNIVPRNPEHIKFICECQHHVVANLRSRNKQWLDKMYVEFDRLTNSNNLDFTTHCAICTLGSILMDKPVDALVTSVSVRTHPLSARQVFINRNLRQPEELGPALVTRIGGIGFARISERQSQFEKVAIFLGDRVRRLTPSRKAKQSTMECVDRRHPAFPLNLDMYEKKEQIGNNDSHIMLPSSDNVRFPTLRRRVLHNLILKVFGGILKGTGWAGIAVGSFVVSGIVTPFPHLTYRMTLPLWIGLIFLGRVLVNYGNRYISGDGWYQFLRHPNNTVLYLRSVHDDERRSGRIGLGQYPVFALFMPRMTIEQELVKALCKLGSVIAVSPSGSKSVSGAARIHLGDEWPGYIVELMRQTKLVVINVGYNRSIRREMSWARQILEPQQVLIHIPEDRWSDYVRYGNDDETHEFRSFIGSVLSSSMHVKFNGREWAHKTHFLWFRPGWRLRPLYSYGGSVDQFDGSLTGWYAEELRPVYKEFGASS